MIAIRRCLKRKWPVAKALPVSSHKCVMFPSRRDPARRETMQPGWRRRIAWIIWTPIRAAATATLM